MPADFTPDELLALPALAGLPAETIAWLLAHGERRTFEAGATIMQAGDEALYLVAVLQGDIQFFADRHGHQEPVFRVMQGQVSGVLPYSRQRVIKGRGVAVGTTELYLLHRRHFPALEQQSPELLQRLVSLMSDRAREETRAQERDDKLRALGKLSAGLAHELNNPAAAISRTAEALGCRLDAAPRLLLELVRHCPDPAALQLLTQLAETAAARPAPPLAALARADQEDELAEWLEGQGVPDGYCLAGGLLDAGLRQQQLTAVAATLPPEAVPAALGWLEAQLTTCRLLQDVREASSRISTLVDNVKTYSHMDRGTDFATLDVVAGLESTLNMLSYPLRAKNIQVSREFAEGLPPVRGQVSSLNQVWTNLLDNSLDALPAGGQLVLRTQVEGPFVRVSVIDDGPGIPADVLPRIFEPFFTTKQAGEGTGLGLDIAQRIVRNHGGRLEVSSRPGHTEFCAWLPVSE